MNSTIKIEFDAGTTISNAFKEAIRISQILGCRVEFKFNDITCWGVPNGSVLTGESNYHKQLNLDTKYKFAHCI